MSKLIKHNNNKQYGGTYVTIKSDDGDNFIIIDDDERIIPNLFEASISINCINYSSTYSIVFVCELPNGDTKIRLHSEVNPEKETLKFCIKITLVKTERTPVNTSGLIFNYSGENVQKEIVSENQATSECETQKNAHDKLFEICHKHIIADTIAVKTVSPETFHGYTEDIFTKQTEQTEQTDKDEILTKYAVKWLIESAKQNQCNIHMFMMDYLEGYTPFNQVLSRLPPFETDIPAEISSVASYHSDGYYKDVYKIAQSAAAQVISILGITGIFNIDLRPGNILVSPDFDTKVIDFGININLQEKTGRLQILQHFSKYNDGLLSSKERFVNTNQLHLLHFLDSLTGISSSHHTIVQTFSSCYNEIISNIATHIDSLLNTETTQETKRQIVFKVLMFLAFIDGLIIKQTFGIDNLQTRVLMKYVFNCEVIFNNLTTFCMSSSFNYMKFLDNAFTYRIEYIKNIKRPQYTRLCNTILDKICENVIGLLSKTCELRRGGSVISKKIFTKRRHRRKSSATKRRRRRTSRK